MDATSSWTLTNNSTINGLITNPGIAGSSVSNIIGNGFNVYYSISANSTLAGQTYSLVGGGFLLPEGNSAVDPVSTNQLALSPNFPNPFTGSTTLSYYLPCPSQVVLSVYYSNGQLAEIMVNETQAEGNHSLIWAPHLPAGTYSCVLISHGSKVSRMMTITR